MSERWQTFAGKKEEKQNSFTIMGSADEKGTFFLVKLKLYGKSFE